VVYSVDDMKSKLEDNGSFEWEGMNGGDGRSLGTQDRNQWQLKATISLAAVAEGSADHEFASDGRPCFETPHTVCRRRERNTISECCMQ
jgi:hypothetical protein